MEVIVIIVSIVVAVAVLGLLARALGMSGPTIRGRTPEWPDRSHQSIGPGTTGPGDGGGGGD